MHKIDKYASSCVKDKAKDIIRSTRSNYYHFNGNVLRISDHVGTCSSGSISLIKTENHDAFVLHRHINGTIEIVNYKQAKEIIKGFTWLSPVFAGPTSVMDNFDLTLDAVTPLQKELKQARNNKTDVLGVPISKFTKGQVKQIEGFVNNIKSKK